MASAKVGPSNEREAKDGLLVLDEPTAFLPRDGVTRLFDAIEFNEEFASIDVFYDLAFLLMDLDCHGLRPLANVVLNRYLERTTDYDGLAALRPRGRTRGAASALVSAGIGG